MSVIEKALSDFFQKHPVTPRSTIGVAVSGGADSLCLAFHLGVYARKNRLILKAVTVDHKLRPESKAEAQGVHTLLTSWGIDHTTLSWLGPKPKTHIEEKAREKRYDLIQKWAAQNQIKNLFLAHHAGDQAETFWIRLAHGSGADGLSAMTEQSESADLTLCRPFLGLSKATLENDLKKRHISWFHDAMNEDESYERVRWRNRQNQLSEWGLTPALLGRTTNRFARIRQALDFYTNRFVSALLDLSPKGFISVQEQAFFSLPDEIRLRVLKKALEIVASDSRSISLESLERWLSLQPKKATLSGCILVRQGGILFVAREASRMSAEKKILPHQWTRWDRFMILASDPVRMKAGSDDTSLPFSIRQSIPCPVSKVPVHTLFRIGVKKELEKKFAFEYKKNQHIVFISFEGKK